MHISETPTLSQIDQLYLLARLRTEGAITDAEFVILKRKVMVFPGGHPELRRFTPRPGSSQPQEIHDAHEFVDDLNRVSSPAVPPVTFHEAIKNGFRNYAAVMGRATRTEFWLWALFVVLGSIATSVVDAVLGMAEIHADLYVPGPLYVLFMLAVFVPSIAVAVRRLHDIDRAGWWYLLILVPVVGLIVLMVWWASKGTYGENEYGPDPLQAEESPIPEPLRLISLRPY